MNLLKTPEFKVGILVVVVSSLIGVMSLKVSESSGFLGGKSYWFTLENAGGLIKNGGVHVAGIRVGVIKQIGLDDQGQARIDVIVQPGVKLTKSSKIQIRANGILGDKQVEIIPGNPADPLLASGDQIEGVDESASLDKLISEAGKITKSLTVVVENFKAATEGDDSKPLGKILKNVESLTGDLAQLVRNKKGDVSEIITTMKTVMHRMDKAMINIEEISTKINEGKGTIGRLINDEELVDSLDTTLTTFGNVADVANKLEVNIEAHSNYIPRASATRTYLGVSLWPGQDRFYDIGIVSTPDGPRNEITRTTTINNGVPTVTNEATVYDNKYKFTAMFGKVYYNIGLKAGMIENTGGVGVEYYAWRRRIKVGIDAFDFNPAIDGNSFNLRPYVRYTVMKGIYVQGGGEDLMNERTRSSFFGAGVFLTSDDLKALISRVNL
jgi:phospholipid/cholesterol/gamma-HCH transport system substrate-binding protein